MIQDTIIKNLANSFEDKILNPDFWENETQITNYIRSILGFLNIKNKSVNVNFNSGSAFEVTKDNDKFSIQLPHLIYKNDVELKKQIYARAILLRHELAHIIFTDTKKKINYINNNFNENNKGQQNWLNLFDWVEDARIEALFSSTFKGSRRAFEDLIKSFKNLNTSVINSKTISINGFGVYFRYRAIELGFQDSPNFEFYENLYNKYSWILTSSDCDKVFEAYNNIINEIIPFIKQKKHINLPLSKESDNDDFEDEELNNEESQEELDNQESEEELGEDGNGEEDLEEESENSEESQNEELDNNGDDEEDEEEDLTTTPIDPYNEIKATIACDVNVLKLEDFSMNPEAFLNSAGVIIPLGQLLKFATRKNQLVNPLGNKYYNQIVHAHKQTISEVTKFLMLKLQHKDKNKNIIYQQEGDLDQDNLKEIIINDNDPRGFLRTIKSVKTNARIIMLIDGSSSMNSSQIRDCFFNAVILIEVCKKLNLEYEVAIYTTSENFKISITRTPVSTLKIKFKNVSNISCKNLMDGCYYPLKEAKDKTSSIKITYDYCNSNVFIIKDSQDKHNPFFEKIIGNICKDTSLITKTIHSSGTPEFESVLAIYKKHKMEKNNIFFIFNDGQYNNSRDMINWMDEDSQNVNMNFENSNFPGKYCDDNFIKNYMETLIIDITNFKQEKYREELLDIISIRKEYKLDVLANPEKYIDIINKTVDRMLIQTQLVQSILINKNINELKNVIKNDFCETWSTIFNNKIKFIGHKNWRGDMGYNLYISLEYKNIFNHDKEEEKYFYWIEQNIKNYIVKSMNKRINLQNLIYRKMIESIRGKGWRVMGFGIRCEYGIDYIGKDYFQVVHNSTDIKKNFAKKLKQIF